LLSQNVARVQVRFWLGLKTETNNLTEIFPNCSEFTNAMENTLIPRQIYFSGSQIDHVKN
jgi:hypothetical protein